MLRAQPGTRLPRHRHKGDEWTCVFEGAFRHEHGRFGPGDFDEADESVEHHPTVEAGVPCICLVALDRGIAFQGWIGRLLQPLVRI
jgi:putative transcriptional regulator